jgi:hypothetical protein
MNEWSVIISGASLLIVLLTSVIGVVWKLSSKVYQVEIWARDEFVRRGSFELVVNRLEKSMEALATKIEGAVDKMTTKVDALQKSQHHRD